jgi:hypothetical protein
MSAHLELTVCAALMCPCIFGCDGATEKNTSCDAAANSLQLAIIDANLGVSSTTVYNSSGVGGGGTISIPAPTPVVLDLELFATLGCPVEGAMHAVLTTSVGTFTNGLATSPAPASGKGTDAGASSGSSGVSGASVTVLLGQGVAAPPSGLAAQNISIADVDAGSTFLSGEASLQAITGRTIQIQAVLGDTSKCWQISVGQLTGLASQPSSGLPDAGIAVPVPAVCTGD